MKDDNYYMQKCLSLAQKGTGYTSPNPLVGSVIVRDDTIVGTGYHQYYGGAHAEVNALNDAEKKARGATLYVNLEPCSHHGKTPPCSQRIIKSDLSKVVIAMKDPNPLVSGEGIRELKEAGIEVKVGVLEKEAKILNEIFIKYQTTSSPFVYLKTAQTLDGYIATRTGDSKWITNKKARLKGHKLRHKVDAILVGINTVLNDNPKLTTRLPKKEGKDSIRIVLDSKLRVPLDANIINQKSSAATYIITGNKVAKAKIKNYQKLDQVKVLTVPLSEEGKIPLKKLLNKLHQKEISSILVEGGGNVNASFFNSGLVDKVYTFIAPKIMGGSDGISSYEGKGFDKMSQIKKLTRVKYQQLGGNLLITGYINENQK